MRSLKSFVKSSFQQLDNNELSVTLHFMSTDDAWVGVGFSRDREMGQDDIYYCQKRAGVVGMISAYSVGMSRPIELDATNNQNGISQLRTYINQNQFVCSFRRPISVTKDNLGKITFVSFRQNFLQNTI